MTLEQVTRGEADAAGTGPLARSKSVPLMLLRLGTRWFAMDVRCIVELALKGTVTRVPTAPNHILGVTTLRGRLVTVVSLEQMIGGAGLLSSQNTATLPRLVVVRDGPFEMAIVAEEICAMTEHTRPAELPEHPADVPDFVCEDFEWQGQHVALLDVPLLVAAAARLSGILSSEEVA